MHREEAEKIFNGHAQNIMANWSINDFKKSHPRLFETVIISIMDAIIQKPEQP